MSRYYCHHGFLSRYCIRFYSIPVFWTIKFEWFQNINGPNASDQNVNKTKNAFGLFRSIIHNPRVIHNRSIDQKQQKILVFRHLILVFCLSVFCLLVFWILVYRFLVEQLSVFWPWHYLLAKLSVFTQLNSLVVNLLTIKKEH